MGSMNRATRSSAEAGGRVVRMAQPYEREPTIGELLWPDMGNDDKAKAAGRVERRVDSYGQDPSIGKLPWQDTLLTGGRVERRVYPYEQEPSIGEPLWPNMAAESKAQAGNYLVEQPKPSPLRVQQQARQPQQQNAPTPPPNDLHPSHLYLNRVMATGRNAQVVYAGGMPEPDDDFYVRFKRPLDMTGGEFLYTETVHGHHQHFFGNKGHDRGLGKGGAEFGADASDQLGKYERTDGVKYHGAITREAMKRVEERMGREAQKYKKMIEELRASDDDLAWQEIEKNTKIYNLFKQNCQDYVEEVIKEGHKIAKERGVDFILK